MLFMVSEYRGFTLGLISVFFDARSSSRRRATIVVYERFGPMNW